MTDPASELRSSSALAADSPPFYPLTFPLRVRWAEVDAQQVVFNGHYLMYADICTTEYFRAAGIAQWASPQVGGSPDRPTGNTADELPDYYVVRATLDYRAPSRFDDLLTLRGRVARLGNSSFTFECRIEREGELLCRVEVVSVNARAGVSRPLPGHFRAAVLAFQEQREQPRAAQGMD